MNGIFVYEADCATGDGYLVVADFPADAVACAALGDGIGDRERDQDTDVVDECKLPGNAMTPERIAAYAQQAGVSCAIGDAVQIGRNFGGAVFEVGCGSGEAFWIQSDGETWSRVNCLKVTGQGGACRFSTPTDQAALLTTRLSNAPTPLPGQPDRLCRLQRRRRLFRGGLRLRLGPDAQAGRRRQGAAVLALRTGRQHRRRLHPDDRRGLPELKPAPDWRPVRRGDRGFRKPTVASLAST